MSIGDKASALYQLYFSGCIPLLRFIDISRIKDSKLLSSVMTDPADDLMHQHKAERDRLIEVWTEEKYFSEFHIFIKSLLMG
jgi:hypothetical protein